jgi:hypothetical protein
MMVLTIGLVGLAVLMLSAGELGRRAKAPAADLAEA